MSPFTMDPSIRRMLDNCLDDDASALRRLLSAAALQNYLNDAMVSLSRVAREEEGASWAQVGEAMFVTRQSAHRRFTAAEPALDAGGLYSEPGGAPGYLAELREAHASLLAEGGRERDLRLIEGTLARLDPDWSGPVYSEREQLLDALDGLRESGGSAPDIARLEAALADLDGATAVSVRPLPVDHPRD